MPIEVKTVNSASLKPYWWQWPTVLSLDAPSVALVWQVMISHVCGVVLDLPRQIILGLSIWLAYVIDRWIEAYRLKTQQIHTKRLMFYHTNQKFIALIWLILFGCDLYLALHNLTRSEITHGLYLFTAVALYLFSHQLLHRHVRWRIPKEICVALILSAGVGFFIIFTPGYNREFLNKSLIIFGLLCFINCTFISIWEKAIDTHQGQASLAREYAFTMRFGRWFALCYTIFIGVFCLISDPGMQILGVCALISSLFLIVIDHYEPKYGRPWARVLADFALLTPLVFTVYWHCQKG